MLKVGLTGGIGTGKSLIAKIFTLLDIPVYIADLKAKKLMNTNSDIREQLIQHFGIQVFDSDSNLDRGYLAKIIFNQPEALQKVNEIVHPVVRADFASWCLKYSKYPYVIQESAILFDTGLYKIFDKIITVTADKEIRIKRIIKRDLTTRELVEERMKNQLEESIKIEKSDYVIFNNLELVLPQVIKIDAFLRSLSKS
ncbi:dephospho-CoA kinase [Ancylomarina longa]|uniref:Dephospho-CoA kinase n=1 Tax=Ancylomarina longa TaxID=2487017 RepID=A0A434AXG4_9BACT|nr:dephospho-CoA kinase [Ancylomarina longa]RUT79219.1 dephospho-CoA kinase [Ancylomarina longa]